MSENNNGFINNLKQMPKLDGLAIGALGLNMYVIYTMANIRSYDQLLQPGATQEIMIIQFSAVMGGLFLAEYVSDSEGKNSQDLLSQNSSQKKGLTSWIADLAEGSKWADGATLATVFLGYNYISQNSTATSSVTEFSLNPEIIAMQLSLLMVANFGIFLISDLSKN